LRDTFADELKKHPEIEEELAAAEGMRLNNPEGAIKATKVVEAKLVLRQMEDVVGTELIEKLGKIGIEPEGIRRILAKGPDLGNVKGRLWDEIFAAEAKKMVTTKAGKEALAGAKLAPEIAEKVEFIPGSSIKDMLGDELTDGILGWREGNKLHVLNIYEAKSGARAATQLRILEERMSRIPAKDLAEIRKLAEETFGELEVMASKAGKELKITEAELEKELLKYRVQKQIGGQVRETIERLDVSVGVKSDLNIPTQIKVNGEIVEVVGVSGSSRVTGVVPADVKTTGIRKALAKEGLNFAVLPMSMKAAEVENLAKQISGAASAAAGK